MKKFIMTALLAVFIATPVMVEASGIPVVDAASIAQDAANFLQQMQQMIQQYQTMQSQLQQQVQHFQAITGDRGMSSLLSGQNRNYIPQEWQDALKILDSPTNFSGIASRAEQIMRENKGMSDDALNNLAPAVRQIVEEERRSLATHKALSEATYNNASQRFSALQTLTSTISAATDEKAILDLQARIQAEEVQLKNDSIKLQAMSESLRAEEAARKQKMREFLANSGGSVRK